MRKIRDLIVPTVLLVKATLTWWLAAFLTLGLGVALAQDSGVLPPIDPSGWGGSPFVFGAFLTLVIATLKRSVEGHFLAKYGRLISNPWLWRGLALALGIGGAFGLNIARFGAELVLFGWVSPWSVLAFGVASSLVAMGYRDLLKTALGWVGQGSPATAPIVVADEVLPPAGTTAPPPSGIGPIGAQPLMGLPLNLGSLETLIDLVLTDANVAATPTLLIRLGARLAVVAPDLLDGDVHLSAENRNRVLAVVMDLKKEGGL
ncbi:hypothetical protein [Deinococcus yunweiensis]|uniref:hypothetical protein n=1 Tax=Deinococcus yunweiensis TaxID=367282 RepID=UPI00398E6BD5